MDHTHYVRAAVKSCLALSLTFYYFSPFATRVRACVPVAQNQLVPEALSSQNPDLATAPQRKLSLLSEVSLARERCPRRSTKLFSLARSEAAAPRTPEGSRGDISPQEITQGSGCHLSVCACALGCGSYVQPASVPAHHAARLSQQYIAIPIFQALRNDVQQRIAKEDYGFGCGV